MDVARLKIHARSTLSVLAAIAIGSIAWHESWLISLAIAVPVLVLLQRSRTAAASVALCYYSAASWPLIAAYGFLGGEQEPSMTAVLFWLSASVLLATPLALAWTRAREPRIWRMALALLMSAVPPLAVIGWASPLTAAGVLFPGTAWFGLGLTAIVPGLMSITRRPGLLALALAAVSGAAHLWNSTTKVAVPDGWSAVNTSWADSADPVDAFAADQTVQAEAVTSKAQVIVFPEGMVKRWTPATEAFWEITSARLQTDRKTAIVGAGLPIPGSKEYLNAAVIRGRQASTQFIQRIPVPVEMWKPFGPCDSLAPRQSMSPARVSPS
jgi:hypothetical protein